MRENVFTQFARAIVLFSHHKISRVQLYDHFVSCVEMATVEERNERMNFHKALNEWNTGDLIKMTKEERPYSNWEKALEILGE